MVNYKKCINCGASAGITGVCALCSTGEKRIIELPKLYTPNNSNGDKCNCNNTYMSRISCPIHGR